MQKAYVIGHDMAHPYYACDARKINRLSQLFSNNEMRTLFQPHLVSLILSQSILIDISS